MIILVLLAGAPIAYLLARSVTGPLRRLAAASADLPSGDPQPLPLEGPTEVRDLTDRFNAMAAELTETRQRESRLLADLRHDLRTPLTVIAGFAAALADGTAVGDDAATAARAIAEEAARLERLVAELEAMERLRGGAAGLRPERLESGPSSTRPSPVSRRPLLRRGSSSPCGRDDSGPATPTTGSLSRRIGSPSSGSWATSSPTRSRPSQDGGHVWLAARPISRPAPTRGPEPSS